MSKNDLITIYHDPYTEQNVEGKAVLLEKMSEDTLFETWLVRFDGDGDTDLVQRRISKPRSKK